MNLVQKSAGVFLAEGPICSIGQDELDMLKAALPASPKRHVRINPQPNAEDGVIESIFAFDRNTYIRPHKHPGRSEAYHIIAGEMDAVLFSDAGEIKRIVRLGPLGDKHPFYYRLTAPIFHTVIIRSDILLMHEIVEGPRGPGATEWAEFAPDADREPEKSQAYHAALLQRVAALQEPLDEIPRSPDFAPSMR
ncbi:cupin fold WbuC family metalloprotein [Bradyrhizobium sp. USDA 4516]